MPLFPPLLLFISWCAAMSLMALLYGVYVGARHASGRPVGGREWLRNFLALFAIAVNSSFLLVLPWTSLPLPFLLKEFAVALLLAWVPLLIWYLFDLPNRAVRYLVRRRRAQGPTPHPLDGDWPPDVSFLDEINARRDDPSPGASAAHPPSPALDRVARFEPAEPSPETSPR